MAERKLSELTSKRSTFGNTDRMHVAAGGISYYAEAQDLLSHTGDVTGGADRVLSIGANRVTTAKIANSAVTAEKIADDAIGSAKLGPLTIDTVTATSYNSVATDANRVKNCSNANPITFDLTAAAHAAGDVFYVNQTGAGQVTFTTTGGTIVKNASFNAKTSGQWAFVTVVVHPFGVFQLIGDLELA